MVSVYIATTISLSYRSCSFPPSPSFLRPCPVLPVTCLPHHDSVGLFGARGCPQIMCVRVLHSLLSPSPKFISERSTSSRFPKPCARETRWGGDKSERPQPSSVFSRSPSHNRARSPTATDLNTITTTKKRGRSLGVSQDENPCVPEPNSLETSVGSAPTPPTLSPRGDQEVRF